MEVVGQVGGGADLVGLTMCVSSFVCFGSMKL